MRRHNLQPASISLLLLCLSLFQNLQCSQAFQKNHHRVPVRHHPWRQKSNILAPLEGKREYTSLFSMDQWEGDDLRWMTRWWRRRRRSWSGSDQETPAKNSLMAFQLVSFLYQTTTTVDFIRRAHPEFWPSHALSILRDVIVGSSVRGPLLMDFGYSNSLAQNHPHRFLTSAFLHGGILHLLVNLDSFRRQPSWLETGLGKPLYLTTFLVSIVGGNLFHAYGVKDPFDRTLVVGMSGGICGLYGLMYGSLIRMGNGRAASQIARGMATVIIPSFFIESISSMSHIGGFLCGIAMAILFSPGYQKNYSMRRKNSAEYDPAPRDFRQVMGFGVMPTERGRLPLSLIWGAFVIFLAAKPSLRKIPALIAKGLLFPGSLTA